MTTPTASARRRGGAQAPDGGSPEQTRFVADAMLGSLARKLRAFGFDTTYFREGADSELLEAAASRGRIILTSDRELIERASRARLPAILVQGKDEARRFRCLASGARGLGLTFVPGGRIGRCSLCNSELTSISRTEVAKQIPEALARRHRWYYRCTACGKIYWHGKHWDRLRRLFAVLPVGEERRI